MEVVPHVDVAEEGGAVVDQGVAVTPADAGGGNSLHKKKRFNFPPISATYRVCGQ